jgi:hypothetical protein
MEKYNKQIMIRITKQDFDAFVRRHNPECFTEKQINQWVLANQELIQKSETDELNDIEKSEVKRFEDEFSSFTKVEVVSASQDILSKGIQYDTYYIREQQIEWDMEKGENDEIVKSSHGRYKDTPHNRKMGRVGQEFGHAKKEEDEYEKRKQLVRQQRYDNIRFNEERSREADENDEFHDRKKHDEATRKWIEERIKKLQELSPKEETMATRSELRALLSEQERLAKKKEDKPEEKKTKDIEAGDTLVDDKGEEYDVRRVDESGLFVRIKGESSGEHKISWQDIEDGTFGKV